MLRPPLPEDQQTGVLERFDPTRFLLLTSCFCHRPHLGRGTTFTVRLPVQAASP